jgi:AcrR family transcriptional regulator
MGVKERRARERAQRREQILAAARHLLLTRGIDRTTITNIAARVELSAATLYTYFPSKEVIMAALSAEGVDLLYTSAASACQSCGDPRRRLRRLARAYLDFSIDHRDYFDMINYFMASPKPVFSEALKVSSDMEGEKIIDLVEAAMAAGMDAGFFRRRDARSAALVFWGALNGVIQLRKVSGTLLGERDYRKLYMTAANLLVESLGRDGSNVVAATRGD